MITYLQDGTRMFWKRGAQVSGVRFGSKHHPSGVANGMTFRDCSFADSLCGMEFHGCLFYNCDFTGVNATGVEFYACYFDECNFDGANFFGARFPHSELRYADFTGARVQKADFEHCNLAFADFTGVDLTGASFRFAHINDTTFSIGGLDYSLGISPCTKLKRDGEYLLAYV